MLASERSPSVLTLREWAAETNYPLNDASDLAKVGQFLAVTEDPMSPKEKIREIFKKLKPPDFTQPDEPHGLLADLPFEVYLTTNYDNFMVQALRSRNRDPKLELCRWNRQLQKLEPSIFKSGFDPTPANPVVFYLHGHIDRPESLVLTEDDYVDSLKNISESPKIIPARIQRALTGASLLFLGYSIADLDFRVIFRSLVSYLEKTIHHAHVSVQLMPIGTAVREGQEKDARRYLDRYFGKLEIRMYWGSRCEFAAELRKNGKNLMTAGRQPFVGPRPFECEDESIFFGRDREACDVQSLAIAHGELVVYAQSGAGKTSLINARLIPFLKQEGLDVFPIARVRGRIPDGIAVEEISNLFTVNTLISWEEACADPRPLLRAIIDDYVRNRRHPMNQYGEPQPRVIIFHQFEELFYSYPERWKDREPFIEQVCEALDRDASLRVVFVLREDYLAHLDALAEHLPEKLQTRYRLDRMQEAAARLAITKPLEGTGRCFEDEAVQKLVEDLLKLRVETATGKIEVVTGEYIEPVQLQVVCRSLWNSLPAHVQVITLDHLRAFGDVNEALSRFYERSLRRVREEAGIHEGDLRDWFENGLITPSGTRGTVYRGHEKTNGIPNSAVDLIESLHLIRGEWRAGARWYELTWIMHRGGRV